MQLQSEFRIIKFKIVMFIMFIAIYNPYENIGFLITMRKMNFQSEKWLLKYFNVILNSYFLLNYVFPYGIVSIK